MAVFTTGNTGASTGAHLDFRVYDPRKGGYVDPQRFAGRMLVNGKPLTEQFSVTSPRGMREHPVHGGQRMHEGIDYGTPEGTQVSITGGTLLSTWDDKGGGGITSQYQIKDDEGNPFEILLMHGNSNNKITGDSAVTNGTPNNPSSPDPSTPSPTADVDAKPADYSSMSGSQMNAEYDKLRKAGDIFKAEEAGMAMHKAHFGKA